MKKFVIIILLSTVSYIVMATCEADYATELFQAQDTWAEDRANCGWNLGPLNSETSNNCFFMAGIRYGFAVVRARRNLSGCLELNQ